MSEEPSNQQKEAFYQELRKSFQALQIHTKFAEGATWGSGHVDLFKEALVSDEGGFNTFSVLFTGWKATSLVSKQVIPSLPKDKTTREVYKYSGHDDFLLKTLFMETDFPDDTSAVVCFYGFQPRRPNMRLGGLGDERVRCFRTPLNIAIQLNILGHHKLLEVPIDKPILTVSFVHKTVATDFNCTKLLCGIIVITLILKD